MLYFNTYLFVRPSKWRSLSPTHWHSKHRKTQREKERESLVLPPSRKRTDWNICCSPFYVVVSQKNVCSLSCCHVIWYHVGLDNFDPEQASYTHWSPAVLRNGSADEEIQNTRCVFGADEEFQKSRHILGEWNRKAGRASVDARSRQWKHHHVWTFKHFKWMKKCALLVALSLWHSLGIYLHLKVHLKLHSNFW